MEQVKKKLLFCEVFQNQFQKSMKLTKNDNEKKLFKKVLSGKMVKRYKNLDQIDMKPMRQPSIAKKSLSDMTRKTRNDKTTSKLEKLVDDFYEEDCNTLLCPDKKDSGTKNEIKKQKRLLLDSMKNLHTKFMKRENAVSSYAMFCRLRSF